MTQFNLLHISDLHFAKNPMREEIFSDFRNLIRFKPLFDLLYSEIPIELIADFIQLTDERKSLFINFYERWKNGNVCASHNPGALGLLAKFIYQRTDLLDAIVITGDIATTGSLEDLNEAKKILSFEPYSNLDNLPPYRRNDRDETPIINGNKNLPIYLLPGNHDRYVIDKNSNNPIKPGEINFFDVFSDIWKEKRVNAFQPIIKDDIALGVIAADFSLNDANEATFPKFLGRLAQGKVDKSVLDELVSKTKLFIKTGEENGLQPIVIWAIHFPPAFPYQKYLDSLKEYFKMLLDEQMLIEKANDFDNQVLLIMAGHTHQPKLYSYDEWNLEIEWYFDVQCSGSSSQYYNLETFKPHTNFCHILTIDVNDGQFTSDVRDFKADFINDDFVEVEI